MPAPTCPSSTPCVNCQSLPCSPAPTTHFHRLQITVIRLSLSNWGLQPEVGPQNIRWLRAEVRSPYWPRYVLAVTAGGTGRSPQCPYLQEGGCFSWLKRVNARRCSERLAQSCCIFCDQEDTILCRHANGHLKSETGVSFCFGIIWIPTTMLSAVTQSPFLDLYGQLPWPQCDHSAWQG